MSQYYYTVSALPLIFYESDIQEEGLELFIDFCSDWLSPEDFYCLSQADYTKVRNTSFGHPLLKAWQEWERALRNALVELRAPKKGEEPYSYLVEGERLMGMEEIAREAFVQESPLIGEEILNRARWAFLDELETGHYFDIEKILIHSLKLQILTRKGQLKKDTGRKVYQDLFQKLTDYDVQEAMKAG